ncbi:MAG: sialidase family protein [Bacteroidota bacterium]
MTSNQKRGVKNIIFGIIVLSFFDCGDTANKEQDTKVPNQEPTNWKRIGPGGGGSTFVPTFSYADEKDFMIRCDMTGAYHTQDGGKSYAQINYPNGSYSFAYDPSDPKVRYIGSNTLNKSIDGGKTWKRIYPFEEDILRESFNGDHASFTLAVKESSLFNIFDVTKTTYHESPTITNIKVDPNDSNTIYFSLENFLFHSQDSGKDWKRLELDGNIDFIFTNTNELKQEVLAFTASGVNSINKESLEITSFKYPEPMKPAFSITGGNVAHEGKSIFYGLHNKEPDRDLGKLAPTTLWKSRDHGRTWQQDNSVLITNKGNSLPTYATLAAAENDAQNVYIVSSRYEERKEDGTNAIWFGALKSFDSGNSWQWVWKAGGGSGEYGVRDGTDASNLEDAWVQKAFGNDFIRLIDVGVAPNNGDVAIVTDWYRSMKTVNGGKSWETIYSTEAKEGAYRSNGLDVTTSYSVHFDPMDPAHIAVSYTDIGFHHSFDQGKSWSRSTNGIPVEWQNTCYWMVFDPDIKDKIWSVWSSLHDFPRGKMTRKPKWKQIARGGVAVSTDGGRSWTPTIGGMDSNTPITSIVLDQNSPVNKRTLYAAAYGKGVFKSIDDGKNWKVHNHGIEGSLAAFELTILPDGTLFLITSPTPQHLNEELGREVFMGAVYKSTDGALSWTRLDTGKKTQFPNGLAFDPENPDRVYLGSWGDMSLSDMVGRKTAEATGGNDLIDLDGGILMSEDGGTTWQRIFDEDHYVYDVTVDSSKPGRVYCNTFNQGAYRSEDYGETWKKLKGYDFHWGHRVVIDENKPEMVFLTTFGSSVWHGKPVTD